MGNKEIRTLYQCLNAKVFPGRIECIMGYPIGRGKDKTSVPLRQLALGKPLHCITCHHCADFDNMGASPTSKDRGWDKPKNNSNKLGRPKVKAPAAYKPKGNLS